MRKNKYTKYKKGKIDAPVCLELFKILSTLSSSCARGVQFVGFYIYIIESNKNSRRK